MTTTFSVTDYKGCRQIELSPTGRLVVIAGGNGAGKSSFIDGITELFDPHGAKLTPKPIRDGADEARAEYTDEDLGLRISRVWKKNGTAGTLVVEALDGAKYSRPSEIVADLLGGAIFDPVAFLNLPDKAQRDALLEKVTLPFDLNEVTNGKAAAEMRRLEAGREVKRLTGALSAHTMPGGDVPDQEVTASDILAEIEEAQRAASARERAQRANDDAAAVVNGLERTIADAVRKLEEARAFKDRAYRALQETPVAPDLEPLMEKLAAVEDTNRAVRARRRYLSIKDELQAAEALRSRAQVDLDEIEQRKAAGLAAADFPVPGLSVDEEGVTFEGVPFGQVNTAMRRRVAFAIATAGQPKLRLVIVKDGDLLDAESLQAIADLAEERDYTVLVERDRDESRNIGFTVRDGVLE